MWFDAVGVWEVTEAVSGAERVKRREYRTIGIGSRLWQAMNGQNKKNLRPGVKTRTGRMPNRPYGCSSWALGEQFVASVPDRRQATALVNGAAE